MTRASAHIASLKLDAEVAERLAAAIDFAVAAGARTLQDFDHRRIVSEVKGDGSPVTVTDRETELQLRASIAAAFPDDGVLGEEHAQVEGTSSFRWILDPIDGTASFINGVPLYGTLVAVERDGEPVAGVVRMPALEETLFAGLGAGAWHCPDDDAAPRPAMVSDVTTLAEAVLLTTSFDYLRTPAERDAFVRLASMSSTRGWSDCYAHVLLATGRVDAVVEPILRPWDIAASMLIVREAGGRCTDWQGRDVVYPACAVLSNGHVHEQVLSETRDVPK